MDSTRRVGVFGVEIPVVGDSARGIAKAFLVGVGGVYGYFPGGCAVRARIERLATLDVLAIARRGWLWGRVGRGGTI